ncbi:ATP-binding cassette domain-containing protein [Tichowtungia aerotolerans]|uniref:ATP-binding cassette domain-containing protein n=1 Tax=Tichowtungia aerotolerans TaxID=2697043 RepID=A0A6P1MAP0_9BACT|nr:ATP-binding cassette domain-containing protein [Tichowtungia aerotolerans]
MIELQGISRVYGSGPAAVHALRPASLQIEEGTFVAIYGASGSGKSTMLNMLGLLDEPTTGSYLLEGRNVANLSDVDRSSIRCRKIGIIFQSFNLFPHFSILENVCMPMRFAGMERHEMKERAAQLLDRVGLGSRLHHSPSQLSGGQCQRVAIARALANNPAVLLGDEPTGNLDEKTGDEIIGIFHELVAEGRTVVMVTHNAEYEKQVQRVIELHDGNVVRQ